MDVSGERRNENTTFRLIGSIENIFTNYTPIYTVFSAELWLASKYAILARFCNRLSFRYLQFERFV